MFHKTNFVSKPIFSPALYDISGYISYINSWAESRGITVCYMLHANIPLRRKTHINRQLKSKDWDNLKKDTFFSVFFHQKEQKAVGMRSEIPIINHKMFKYWFRTSFTLRKAIMRRGNTELRSVLLRWDLNAAQDSISCFESVLASGLNLFLQTDQSLRKRKHYTRFFCCIPTFPFGHLTELLN